MFAAFANGDISKLVETVSEDTVWIYHGTQIIPKGAFEKRKAYELFLRIFWKEPKSSILKYNNIWLKAIQLWFWARNIKK